jgi:MinD-like ATPase involved in chromosome partitioning or flagellar assembly
MIRAVNEGVPVTISRPVSPASLALQRLAQTLLGAAPAVSSDAASDKRRRGLFGRR